MKFFKNVKAKFDKKITSLIENKINKAIQKDCGDGLEMHLDDLYFKTEKNGKIHFSVYTEIETSIGSIARIMKQAEES